MKPAESDSTGMRLYLLGTPKVEADSQQLKIGRQKAFALLSYLAVTRQMHRRETLASLLWPDTEPSLAYSYLRRDFSALKKELGSDWFESDRHSLGFVPKADFWSDTVQFRTALDRCSSHGHPLSEVCPDCLAPLSEAVELYRGDFLTGFDLPDSTAFDEWKNFEILDFRTDMVGALTRIIDGYSAYGNYDIAITYTRRWLRLDPLHEPAHQKLIELYARSGNWSAAEQHYDALKHLLYEELKLQPDEITQQLYRSVKEKKVPTPPAALVEAAPQKSRPHHNLPPQLTPFVGRKREINEIVHLLLSEPGCRMLTLVGHGGIGKTRLAIQAANQMLHGFYNGIFLVPLAPVDSNEHIVPSIAKSLSLSFQGRMEPKHQLLNYLREKELLLILDNFEHLIGGADLLIEILSVAPRVKFLITSRERLNLSPEWNYLIEGLTYPAALPEAATQYEAGIIDEFSALGLFLERANRLKPGLSLTPKFIAAIVRICQLVEGVPLGIELASSWLRVLSLEEIAGEIERDLDFLHHTAQDAPDRHSSLRAIFEHSWSLLSDSQKDAYQSLSLFRGGFQRYAAEQVFGISLRLLTALVDKSLIYRTPTGRYSMHELSRQYAEQKLDQSVALSGELRDRLSSFYASYLAQREHRLRTSAQASALSEIAVEIDNIRVSWHWAVRQGDIAGIQSSLESLYLFYYTVGWVQEGENFFQEAAARLRSILNASLTDGPDALLTYSRILSRQARFSYRLGRHRQAKELLDRSLHIFDTLAEQGNQAARREMAAAHFYMSVIQRGDGEYQAAEALCKKSLDYFESHQDQAWTAAAHKHLGIILGAQGQYELARQWLLSALETYQVIADQFGIADTLNDLGNIAIGLGELQEARRLNQECLSIRQNANHLWGIGTSLNNLGYLALVQKDYEEARHLFVRSLKIHREIGDIYQISNCLSNLGQTMFALKDYKAARSCFSEGLRHAQTIGAQPILLENLAGIALLQLEEPPVNLVRAVELLAFVWHHPACDQMTKDRAGQELKNLAKILPQLEIETASFKGRSLELASLVRQMLEQESFVQHPVNERS